MENLVLYDRTHVVDATCMFFRSFVVNAHKSFQSISKVELDVGFCSRHAQKLKVFFFRCGCVVYHGTLYNSGKAHSRSF